MDPDHALELDFRAIRELSPGPRWQALFEEFWPAYDRWFRGRGAPPTYLHCARAMREHMPELRPTWTALVDLAGGGDDVARFLSLYRPPPVVAGCSQAAWARRGEVALVHNYDYAPRLCDGIVLLSGWTRTRSIVATDCLIGALDGMNEDGLAVALAFGGRPVVGDGFGAPMVVRYLLETCARTEQAVASLQRVPVYMSYTFAILDERGDAATVFCAPDRPAVVNDELTSTNHQQRVEWPRYATSTDTVRRGERLKACIAASASLEDVVQAFLTPPLHRSDYRRGSGTLYTVVYRPRDGVVEHRWPGSSWRQSFDGFDEGTKLVRYDEATSH